MAIWAIGAVIIGFGSSQYLQLAIARDQSTGLRLVGPVALARTVSFLGVAVVVAGYLVVSGTRPSIVGMAVAIGVGTVLGQWAGVFETAFFGLERMSVVAVKSIVFRAIGLLATLVVIWADLGVFGVLWSDVLVTGAGLALLIWLFRRLAPLHLRSDRAMLRRIVVHSIPFMTVGLALTLYRQVDIIVISRVAGDRDLGWYSAADKLFGSLMFPTSIVLGSVFPAFGRLHETDRDALHDLVRRTFGLLLLVSIPLGLGAAVVGPSFASILFGSEFSGTGAVIAIMGPITILTLGTTLLSSLAVATERQRLVAGMLFVSAVLTVPLDIVLVPWASDRFDNGAIGGALAFVATETMQFAVGLVVIAPYIVTRPWAWRTARQLAAGGCMVAAAWPFREMFVLVPAAVGGVVYLVAVLVLRAYDEFDRTLVRDLIGRLRR